MNLPNKLTCFRMLLVPAVVLLLLLGTQPLHDWLAGGLFVIASLTDLIDGKIARKYNMVTNFGKLMDPLADKLLVCSVLICLVSLGRAPVWATLIVVAREFAISGIRLIAAERQMVIAASRLGKLKTNFQTFWCIALLFPLYWGPWKTLTAVLMIAAVLLTVLSFAEYVKNNVSILKESGQ